MVIENVSFAEIPFQNDIIFIPYIIKGNNDNGVIDKFITFFGLLKMDPDYRYSDGGPLKILCTRDTYQYIIPYKLDEFCKSNKYKYRFTSNKYDKNIKRIFG